VFKEWPGNDEAKARDFEADVQRDAQGNVIPWEDGWEMHLPPSFKEFEKEVKLLRPQEYLEQLAYDTELAKRKQARKVAATDKRRTSRKKSILAISQASIDELAKKTNEEREKEDPTLKKEAPIVREELEFKVIGMEFLERLETQDEIKLRREEEERKAALEKTKKKPLAKG